MVEITYHGSEKDITNAVALINKHHGLKQMKEENARLKIQEIIDKHKLKASILVNGDMVWSKRRILRNVEAIIKHHTLYHEDQREPPILSQYFYQFLHTLCGSMDHYDIHGWIHRYPTVKHLKQFFKENEFGQTPLEFIPDKFTDAKEIVKGIEIMLFPFENYMKSRSK